MHKFQFQVNKVQILLKIPLSNSRYCKHSALNWNKILVAVVKFKPFFLSVCKMKFKFLILFDENQVTSGYFRADFALALHNHDNLIAFLGLGHICSWSSYLSWPNLCLCMFCSVGLSLVLVWYLSIPDLLWFILNCFEIA